MQNCERCTVIEYLQVHTSTDSMRLCFFLLFVAVSVFPVLAQNRPELTVDMIMQDPETWIGAWPSDVFWTDDAETIYFSWNPQGQFESDSLFKASVDGGEAVQLTPTERRNLPPRFRGWHASRLAYDSRFGQRVFEQDGDLFIHRLDTHETTRLTRTAARESNPRFSPDGQRIVYREGDNLYSRDASGVEQLTDIRSGSESEEGEPSEQEAFLEAQQARYFDVLRERAHRDSLREAAQLRDENAEESPPTYYIGEKNVSQLQISPAGRWVTFVLSENDDATNTRLTNYVTSSGFAEDISARPKVGSPIGEQEFFIQDLERDTTYSVDFSTLPGAFDPAEFKREQGLVADSTREFWPYGPYWSPDGRFAVLDVRSSDNKHRWIVRLDPENARVSTLDHQYDDAWIAGPGISWWAGESDVGWMADNKRFWFQSESSNIEWLADSLGIPFESASEIEGIEVSDEDLRALGARFGREAMGPGGPSVRFSHLWVANLETGEVEALTGGPFEVSNPQLSKDGQTWYFQSSEGSPHESHVYRMGADGGERTRLTRLSGRNDYALSPDEKWLGLLYSQSNQPPEVILEPATPMEQDGRQAPIRYLTSSPTEDWLAYPWREAEIITIPASDGVAVPARIYRPENPNGAAVLFVHGAGYLQNVHRWWSGYYREYQFHNLLADQGYLVLDLDYRASAGYGRDWRAAVYRHMGGRDLQDYVDASTYVGEQFGIHPERVAIYGGSYGGFIALMALFTEPEHFGGGAALRSVTDWAHYNHGYTANILNTPVEDSLAYARSSPIEFADGLEDPLLMAHGLIDDNVQPQDIFRLSQRLIELRKENWELAMYPVEAHGFQEPTSWADEYKRILRLIERSVGPGRRAQGGVNE